MAISADNVKKLREKTGAGIMDCKAALEAVKGDFEKAVDVLRKKGIAAASKKMGRIVSEGIIYSYIHGEGRIGVLVEVNSETDFVARNDLFKEFVKDIAMQIAASQPLYISETEIPKDIIEREREIYLHQAQKLKKPVHLTEKIVEGKLQKFYDEVCLLRQPYIKDSEKKVSDLLCNLIAKIGENCQIRRFVRYQLGEGIEKKKENFAEEVAKQIKK